MILPNLENRALHVSYHLPYQAEGVFEYGTAFTIRLNRKLYIVSAKHLFIDAKCPAGSLKIEKIRLFKDQDWKDIQVKLIGTPSCGADLIVFSTNEDLKEQEPWDLVSEGDEVNCGQDAYFLGFPLGKMSEAKTPKLTYPTPFINRAFISGRVHSDPCRAWVLDGQSISGLSGGPIFTNVSGDSTTPDYKVIGVNVTIQLIHMPIVTQGKEIPNHFVPTCTGMIFGTCSSLILEVIENEQGSSLEPLV